MPLPGLSQHVSGALGADAAFFTGKQCSPQVSKAVLLILSSANEVAQNLRLVAISSVLDLTLDPLILLLGQGDALFHECHNVPLLSRASFLSGRI